MNDHRFWQKVDKSGDCWLWIGHRHNVDGYGRLSRWRITRTPLLTHRYAWMLTRGPIPPGAWVLHHCDNRICVNPSHLFLGDAKANTYDMIRKGRASFYHPQFGEAHGNAKLCDFDVRLIRQLLNYHASQRDIARLFNVSQYCVWRVSAREGWTHLS